MSILVELLEGQYDPAAFAGFVSRPGFGIGTARAMAWMSQLAYETRWPDKIKHVGGEKWELAGIRLLQQPAKSTLPLSCTNGILATKNGAMIIAFAGTDPPNLPNWITNFYLGAPSADVHQGFEDAAAAVWAEIEKPIETCVRENRPLFVVGHSLGAAIALATVDRARTEKRLAQAEVYIFGSPRVFKAELSDRYNASFGTTTYRFVHGTDIVPTVPPSELGFRHVGRLLQCGRGQKFEQKRLLDGFNSDEPLLGSDPFSGFIAGVRNLFAGPPSPASRMDILGKLSGLLAPGIGDHLPDRYYSALTR